MSSFECLRDFVNERLSAAAEEIFEVFIKTVAEYEEEKDRQRRLLDGVQKPDIHIELPQQHVYKEEEMAVPDQQLFNQERNSNLDQEDPEPPQIKEEQEELCTSQEGEQLVLKLETDTFTLTPTYEESDQSLPETQSDLQFLSHNSCVAESQDQEDSAHRDSGSSRVAEEESKKRQLKSKQRNDVYKPNSLETHSNTQTDKKPFTCYECGKAFGGKFKLTEHMSIHTGEKPYSCQICGKDFRQKNALGVHIRIHTGEKPCVCKTCGNRFRDISALKKHMTIHTGERPYSCKICGKDFRYSHVLTDHMRIHTGERPYVCETCGKDFRLCRNLKAHMALHTREKQFIG